MHAGVEQITKMTCMLALVPGSTLNYNHIHIATNNNYRMLKFGGRVLDA